jgi:hypothetical protein
MVALASLFVLGIAVSRSAQAQTFTVLHTFTGGADGASPFTGLTMDRGGNLYSTAINGGTGSCTGYSIGCGTVFRMSHSGSDWIFAPLYSFQAGGSDDGEFPAGRVAIAPDGVLYGTTSAGGEPAGCSPYAGCGTIFSLRPSPDRPDTVLSPWTETILYRFRGNPDGNAPAGDLTFDAAGDLYGITEAGGSNAGFGTVYELARSNGGWSESVLYNFTQPPDGGYPKSGVIFDQSGSLYGTASLDGADYAGTVYQLTPSGSSWSPNLLYTFTDGLDGGEPIAGLIFDNIGNLVGATAGGSQGAVVFRMTPSNGGWSYTPIYTFSPEDYAGPEATLVMDALGNLYGTLPGYNAGHLYGSVFKLTPTEGGWVYTDLHDFTGGSDGGNPLGSLILDLQGNLYGTAAFGGSTQRCSLGCGVVFEITP